MPTIKNVEVFATGSHGTDHEYTEADLDQIVASYDPDLHDAPLTVDHAQTGQAFGWVRNLRRESSKLLCDITGIPEQFMDLLKAGAYKTRSIEIYKSASILGKKVGGLYLKCVSMLGAAAPAVIGLKPIQFSEETEAFDTFDFPYADFELFRQPTEDPNPRDHGRITQDRTTSNRLDHWHRGYLDDQESGFTGVDIEIDDAGNRVVARTDHWHRVVKGKILDSGPIPHDHQLLSDEFAQTEKEIDMPDKPKEAKTDGAASTDDSEVRLSKVEKALEMSEANTKVEREKNAEMVKRFAAERDERFRKEQIATTEAVLDLAIREKKVAPGDREAEMASFTRQLDMAVRLNAIEFSEEINEGLEAFRIAIAARKPSLLFAGEKIDTRTTVGQAQKLQAEQAAQSADAMSDRVSEEDDPVRFSRELYEETLAYMKEHGITDYTEALIQVDRRHNNSMAFAIEPTA